MTARASRWLLVFPPLVYSNWGEYYPATAALAAVLARCGGLCTQVDLNGEFLRWLADPARLAAEECRLMSNTEDTAAIHRAAAALALQRRTLLFDEHHRLVSNESGAGREVALELSRPFHVDERVAEVLSPIFAESAQAAAYRRFFDASSLATLLDDDEYAVVGLSVPMGPQIAPAVLLARWLKERRPDIKIVAGGPSFTLMATADLACFTAETSGIDVIVRYEGETAVTTLAAMIADGAWQRDNTGIQHPAPRVRDLPFPLYDPALLAQISSPRLSVLQARGCYWGKCAYCDFIELYNSNRAYDGRTVDAVYREMEWQWTHHGVFAFWLVTEALPPKFAQRLAERLIAEGVRIDWRSFAMVDPGFTADTLGLLKESGCSSLTVGLESMNSRVLKLVRKKADEAMNAVFLNNLKLSGLKIDLNLIPDLPTTTYVEALDALDALLSYADCFRTISVFPFEATRSSEIGRDPPVYGLTPTDTTADDLHPKGQAQFSSNRLNYRDCAMSADERAEVFARYRAFARRSDSAAGPVVALPGQRVVLYDWGRDRLWRLPTHGGRVSAREAAEQVWQVGAARLDQVPSVAAAVRAAAESGQPRCVG